MEQDVQQTPLQPYNEPTLTEYGDIHEITQGTDVGVPDDLGGGSQLG